MTPKKMAVRVSTAKQRLASSRQALVANATQPVWVNLLQWVLKRCL
jgi:hypothetical protein